MKDLRKRLLALDPTLETYAAVDTGVAMEKPWAERAGLGWIGKNGCLIDPRLGSWLTLSVMFVDREVDGYDAPAEQRCGDCALCLTACPTGAFAEPGVVDAHRCISYHSIENQDVVPPAVREGFGGRIFGCDVCRGRRPGARRVRPAGVGDGGRGRALRRPSPERACAMRPRGPCNGSVKNEGRPL